ncbi:hypothetical protein, partial [Prevotellamassilia timonensis]|uniref:hypothetical protein n=1 Tax=Prevotellamassilia timonensis TaxID=1852370 RepID=UPI00307BB3CC
KKARRIFPPGLFCYLNLILKSISVSHKIWQSQLLIYHYTQRQVINPFPILSRGSKTVRIYEQKFRPVNKKRHENFDVSIINYYLCSRYAK